MKKTTVHQKPSAPRNRFRVERRGGSSRTTLWRPLERPGFHVVGRNEGEAPESLFEKQLVVPALGNVAPRDHVWAVAKFASDIMAEHAFFFSLLMPPEVAKQERLQAIEFNYRFERLVQRLDAKGPPAAGAVRGFVRTLKTEFEPFIDYKRDNHRAQTTGALRSLVWPLFFDHTRREAERCVERLDNIASGQINLERKEVVGFWAPIMDDHFRFIAHLLDPDEHVLVKKAFQNSAAFHALGEALDDGRRVHRRDQETAGGEDPAQITAMANEVLEFKTDAVRQLEAGKIKSIISPILGDHVRREAAWFVDELKRIDA